MRHAERAAAALMAACWVAGCGGGGGGAEPPPAAPTYRLSGTAAAGAPIIGTVTLKDRDGLVRQARIAADGSFALDVAGLRAPFVLRADGIVGGKSYSVYSAGVAADVNGRVNITPFTDLILANVAHDLAAAYFDAEAFGSLTKADLDAQAAALRTRLLPVLQAVGLGQSVDLLRAAFSTDHSGLDAVLDVVKVDLDPATKVATVRNIMDGSSFANDVVDAAFVGSLTGAGVTQGLALVDQLSDHLAALTRAFAVRRPTEAELLALDLFDTTDFLDDGKDWGQTAAELSQGPQPGVVFRDISVESIGADTAWVAFEGLSLGVSHPMKHLVRKDPGTGRWRFAGNRRRYQVQFSAVAQHHPHDVPVFTSGLSLSFQDPGDRLLDGSYVVVSGNGIPATTFYKDVRFARFTQEVGRDLPGLPLTDGQIAAIPPENPAFTLDVFSVVSSVATQDDSFTVSMPRGPIPPSTLTPGHFIRASALSPPTLAGFGGGLLQATLVAPVEVPFLWFFAYFSDEGYVHQTGKLPGSRAGDVGTVVVPPSTFDGWTPAHGALVAGGRDVFGRAFETFLLEH